jgi:hypothetical protein
MRCRQSSGCKRSTISSRISCGILAREDMVRGKEGLRKCKLSALSFYFFHFCKQKDEDHLKKDKTYSGYIDKGIVIAIIIK